jgi:hypothetical protein
MRVATPTSNRDGMMDRDPYDVAIDQILEGSEGDIRLALRTVLIQNLKLQARLTALSEKTPTPNNSTINRKNPLN